MPSHQGEDEDKPCRACSDFKSWTKNTKAKMPAPNKTSVPPIKDKECPLHKEELGKSTWEFLHTMASHFPEKPTKSEAEDMVKFFNIFAQFYPCEPCALDFKEDVQKHPPKAKTRDDLAKWLCDRHNTVNMRLGKPIFDCSKVHERWKDGWLDGSCD